MDTVYNFVGILRFLYPPRILAALRMWGKHHNVDFREEYFPKYFIIMLKCLTVLYILDHNLPPIVSRLLLAALVFRFYTVTMFPPIMSPNVLLDNSPYVLLDHTYILVKLSFMLFAILSRRFRWLFFIDLVMNAYNADFFDYYLDVFLFLYAVATFRRQSWWQSIKAIRFALMMWVCKFLAENRNKRPLANYSFLWGIYIILSASKLFEMKRDFSLYQYMLYVSGLVMVIFRLVAPGIITSGLESKINLNNFIWVFWDWINSGKY